MNDTVLTNGLTKERLVEIGIRLGAIECYISQLLGVFWDWDYEDKKLGILSNEDILCEYLTECICLWGEVDGK